MRKLNIGLLGAGNMGRTHAYALNSMKYFYHLTGFSGRLHPSHRERVPFRAGIRHRARLRLRGRADQRSLH